jgi:hypothetical protein
MSDLLFLIIGSINSLFLIFIFLIRKKYLTLLQRYGRFYFLLAFPALANIFLILLENEDIRYIIFLGIFLAFLIIEWIYDYKLKIDFREQWLKQWKWTVPYLGLYYAMNYGFIVMPWKTHVLWGAVMLCLFIIQIVANIRSHPKTNTKT